MIKNVYFLVLLLCSTLYSQTADQIMDIVSKNNKTLSEEANIHVLTELKGRSEKDEYYNFYFKSIPDSNTFLFADEDNPNSKLRVVQLKDKTLRKERFIKSKGYQLVTTDSSSNRLWGIDVDDLDFSHYKKENFSFHKHKKKSFCSGEKKDKAYVLSGTPKEKKTYSRITLYISIKHNAVCKASFYKGSKKPFKRLKVKRFIKKGLIVRPAKVLIEEAKKNQGLFKAVITYTSFKFNKVKEDIFR